MTPRFYINKHEVCHYCCSHPIDGRDRLRADSNLTFATGQSARLVIGQPEFDAEMDSASQTVLGSMTGLAFANNTLFVADANIVGSPPVNNRVMIYQNMSQQLPAPNAALQYNTLCPVVRGIGQPGSGPAELHQHSAGALHHPAYHHSGDHHSHHPDVPHAHRPRRPSPPG